MSRGILFLVPTPPPVLPQAEAYAQEIEALRARFGGELLYINPNRHLPRNLPCQLPRPVFGLARLPRLLWAARRVRAVQLYTPTPFPYPVLFLLPRPKILALSGSVRRRPRASGLLRRLSAITVADNASLRGLQAAGLDNARRVRAGIDVDRFAVRPLSLGDELRLLSASAPWTREQIASKGIEALLGAVAADRRLHLTLLLRGLLGEEILQRVRQLGISGRVRIVDRLADVDAELAAVHATVNLATSGDLVKAYPHSLMESLAAGKPVLVSRAIPMAEEVAANGAGVVVEEVTVTALLGAADELRRDYEACCERALVSGRRDYSLAGLLSSFGAVYDELAPAVGEGP